jgi:hypothetical protein
MLWVEIGFRIGDEGRLLDKLGNSEFTLVAGNEQTETRGDDRRRHREWTSGLYAWK